MVASDCNVASWRRKSALKLQLDSKIEEAFKKTKLKVSLGTIVGAWRSSWRAV